MKTYLRGLLALLAALALLTAACGSDDDGGSSSDTTGGTATQDLTLGGLASELGITPHQLSQILNERLEKSFSAYVNQYRVMEARELIAKEPDRSLLSVCHAAGFNSKSAFNRAFRQVCGETPQQFRHGLGILSGVEK